MQIIVEQARLLTALDHLKGVIERRNTIPILGNVLMVADAESLTMTGTDLDIEVTETIPCGTAKKGAVSVPVFMLHDMVRKAPAGSQITLSLDGKLGGQMSIKVGRSNFTLPTLPKEDFPSMATERGSASTFSMPASALRLMIDTVKQSMSTEETRYYLNGIYLHDAKGKLYAVTTDGHRLTRFSMDAPDGAAGMRGIIVPRKTALELSRLLADVEGDVEIAVSEFKVRATWSGCTMVSKLIDGTYPEYDRVIPKSNDHVLEVETKALSTAIDRAAIVFRENGSAVKLSVTKDTVTASANSPENGTASDEVDATYTGPDLQIGFNNRYLNTILGQVDADKVRFRFWDGGSPALIDDPEDDSTLYVLMPMRV